MFCCQLEELIRWLYDVADITDSWIPASPDAGNVKASLRRCLVGMAAAFPSPSSGLRAASGTEQDTAGTVRVGGGGCVRCAKLSLGTLETRSRGICSPGNPPQGCLFQKPLLSSAPLLLAFPGVQEGRGRPPEPDGARAGEGRSSPRLHGIKFAR